MTASRYFLYYLCAATLIPLAAALQSYQNNIPNGYKVPNPCAPSTTWAGVGHTTSAGNGARTQFGNDFTSNGHTWTAALCRLDSDGDGKTNGVELGDPQCVWTSGATPAITNSSQLSHPGICEPITASSCQNYNIFLGCSAATTPNVNQLLILTITMTVICALFPSFDC